jgi:UDP-N-acetylglucosamine--N-acetylmuramyl-(pentapeptide) pyrophosphoryl-undecaprenol N-acetylglucosamine transferase
MGKRIIISGGGTGGHIFPAIAIAGALQERLPDVELLFVGANGRMEMQRVPQAGFRIEGLDIYGLQRKITLKNCIENLKLPFRLYRSMKKAAKIIKDFKPDVVVGVGGYASGPILKVAATKHIPTLIQEQNSYPGITNKLLAKQADTICTAYDNLERFFPIEKIIKTGNPVRKDILNPVDKKEAYAHFQLDSTKKTIAAVGGSLGARTLNESIASFVEELAEKNIQLIWQTGESYYNAKHPVYTHLKGIRMMPFVQRMDYLYIVADVVVSRAGALAISELCVVSKPCILIPSPNVAEDHQTKNAAVLSHAGAAILIPDKEANGKLRDTIISMIEDEIYLSEMRQKLSAFARPHATRYIVDEIIKLMNIK